jgi:magnesium transporter
MLINCVAYQDGRKFADIGAADIKPYLAEPGCFVWLAHKDPSQMELAELQEALDLHPLAVEDARHGHQRPKIDEFGGSLFTVLHLVEMQAGGDNRGELTVGEVMVFVGHNYVVSIRTGAEKGFADVRTRCEQEPELLKHGPAFVLYALMDSVVDRYFPVLDQLETELEELEDRIFAGSDPRANIEVLYLLKRKLTTLKHAVAPLLDGASKLYGGRVPPVCAGLGDYFRDVSDHLVRINQSIDTARDTIGTAISVNLSLITVQEGEVVKRLASYGALIAVPTFIVGVYGMNFAHMPELEWRFGYALAMLLIVVSDVAIYWLLRRAKWV